MHVDAQRDLAMIRQLMQDGERVTAYNGKYFVVWGVLVATALVLTYARATGVVAVGPGWIWGVALTAGWVYSVRAAWRDARRARVSTLAGRVLGGIWVGCGVTLTLVGGAGVHGGLIAPGAIGGVVAAVLGGGYFATSFISGQSFLRVLAVGWWAGAVAVFVWPGVHALLLLAAMVLGFQVVPGVVLHARSSGAVGERA